MEQMQRGEARRHAQRPSAISTFSRGSNGASSS